MVSLIQKGQTYTRENNTLAAEQTLNSFKSLSENMQKGIKPVQDLQPLFSFLMTMDPPMPVPCEFTIGDICEFYMNEETNDCFMSLRSGNIGGLFGFFAEPKITEYRGTSFVSFGANIFVLFVEGYLLSSVILFAYRRIRKSQTARPPTSSFRSDPSALSVRGN